MTRHVPLKATWFSAPEDIHDDSLELVASFATAMAAKLAKAQRKYGYSNNWKRDDWMDECRMHLHQHIQKGDPLDVANYCAFLWHHGSNTKPHCHENSGLLSALKEVLDAWEFGGVDHSTINVVRSAIAKANGELP